MKSASTKLMVNFKMLKFPHQVTEKYNEERMGKTLIDFLLCQLIYIMSM